MNTRRIATTAVLMAALAGLASAQIVYKKLGVVGSGQNQATAINNAGQLVVNTATPNSTNVSLWNWLGGYTDLGLASANANGLAINDSAMVVGPGTPSGSLDPQAFAWQPVGGLQWLGSLGSGMSIATGVNSGGTVVGLSYTADFLQHAFLWTNAEGMQDLTPDLTSNGATATAINSSDQVVGYYYPNGSTRSLGFLWTPAAGRQDLGSVGTLPMAINEAGTVVGQTTNSAGFRHAFSWTSSGGLQDLGTLGGAQSTALGINNKGWIVGTSMTGNKRGFLHAFLWTPAGGMQDLVTLAGVSPALQAYSVQINDFGVIALSTNNSLTTLFPIMNLTISSSKNPSKAGEAVTFTATMSSFAGAPPDGDTVQFLAGSQLLGTGTFSNGVAQVTTTALRTGSRAVIAKFLGDPNYLQAKSPVLTQVVNP